MPDELPDLSQFNTRDYVEKLCYLWLKSVGPVATNRELAESIGCDETTVGKKLERLREAGLISRKRGSISAK